MPSQFAPPLPEAILLQEKGWLQGAIVGGVAYGACLILFCISLPPLIILNWKRDTRTRFSLVLLAYAILIFVLTTFFMGSLARFTEMAFIENRNYKQGPSDYEEDFFNAPESELGNVSFVVANWLSDAMIVWRCLVIYRGCRFPTWLVAIVPTLLFLASCTFGFIWLLQISTSSPFASIRDINWTVPYLSMSLGLNILMTVAIVARLAIYRRRAQLTIGPGYGSEFTSVSAIMVESAALYSFFSLLFLISFALGSPVSTVFLQSLCQIQTSASLLIVYRVAQGKGWNDSTTRDANRSRQQTRKPVSVIQFRTYTENPSLITSVASKLKFREDTSSTAATSSSSHKGESFLMS